MSVIAVTGRRDTKVNRLRGHHLLTKCSHAELRRLSTHFDEVHLHAGDTLLESTPLARWLFLIDEGRVEVIDEHGRVGTLGPGDTCGLSALNLRDRQTTTARALTDVVAFAATGRDLLGLVAEIPSLSSGPLGAFLPPPSPPAPRPPRPTASPRPRPRPQPIRPYHPRTPPAPGPVARMRRSRRKVWAIIGGCLAVAVVVASQYHPPVLLLSPGPVIDITNDVTISGAAVHAPNGRYLLTSVRVSRPSLLEMGFLGFRGQVEVVPLRNGNDDRDTLRRKGQEQFRASRLDAARAGARSAGVDAGKIDVRFRDRDIIGPSAGLIYALLVNDLLTSGDLSAGRAIAATGTIDGDGGIGLVTGIAEKAAALRRVGATLLLLPMDQLAGSGGYGVTVVGVASLTEAIAALRFA